jgi:hypothetical protein
MRRASERNVSWSSTMSTVAGMGALYVRRDAHLQGVP